MCYVGVRCFVLLLAVITFNLMSAKLPFGRLVKFVAQQLPRVIKCPTKRVVSVITQSVVCGAEAT